MQAFYTNRSFSPFAWLFTLGQMENDLVARHFNGIGHGDWVDRLEMRRGELRLTQEKMAEECGVTTGGYNHWLSRKRVPDKLESFERIAKAIGRSPAWLLYGAYPPGEDKAIDTVLLAMESVPPEVRYRIARVVDVMAKPHNEDNPSGPGER